MDEVRTRPCVRLKFDPVDDVRARVKSEFDPMDDVRVCVKSECDPMDEGRVVNVESVVDLSEKVELQQLRS